MTQFNSVGFFSSTDTKNIKLLQRKPTNKRLFLRSHLAMLKEHSPFKNSTLETTIRKSKGTVANKQLLNTAAKQVRLQTYQFKPVNYTVNTAQKHVNLSHCTNN